MMAHKQKLHRAEMGKGSLLFFFFWSVLTVFFHLRKSQTIQLIFTVWFPNRKKKIQTFLRNTQGANITFLVVFLNRGNHKECAETKWKL